MVFSVAEKQSDTAILYPETLQNFTLQPVAACIRLQFDPVTVSIVSGCCIRQLYKTLH